MKKVKQLQVSFVTFFDLSGELIDIELYRNYGMASKAFIEAVKKEFAGTRREWPDAVEWEEKKKSDTASIKWMDSEGVRHGMFIQVGIAVVR